jgi:hypothetical protein
VERAVARRRVACSLGLADLAMRRARWRRLVRQAALAVASTGRGLQIEFRGEPGVESELRELTELERGCCAFADWSLRADSDRLVLEVVGCTDEGVASVRAMFGITVDPAEVVRR